MGGTLAIEADVDPRIHSTTEHVGMAIRILEDSGTTAFLELGDKADKLCTTVAAMYQTIPYHNFKHAFNVMHTTYLLLESCTHTVPFTSLETAGLLLAALCHDVQHNGRTSGFHKTINSPFAKEFGTHKGSILEAMHANVALETLVNEHIFDSLNDDDCAAIKTFIEELILATDMALHPQIVKEFAEKRDVLSRAKMILHCADISNPTKRPDIAKWWSHNVMREFCAQVEEEAKLGLPISGFMKADLFSPEEAKLHLGFIDSFALPAWRLMAASNDFGSYVTVQCMSNMVRCRQTWLDVIDREITPVADDEAAVERKRKRFDELSTCGDVADSTQHKRRYLKVNRISTLESPVDCHVT
ncbi:Aste57867_11215 [Aphanomyces stellatus]|uniref:Aste57867_11215 protein n=1 Tax=Aphanomyces stellatus TaxID=120398 RepID=A0A485KSS5_9STRA|nr:hypothetical protein As57867_011173 [Aphanomyces stellatus]VFT88081.1 Aste57867_11215 [Aphanomyces stellatus]